MGLATGGSRLAKAVHYFFIIKMSRYRKWHRILGLLKVKLNWQRQIVAYAHKGELAKRLLRHLNNKFEGIRRPTLLMICKLYFAPFLNSAVLLFQGCPACKLRPLILYCRGKLSVSVSVCRTLWSIMCLNEWYVFHNWKYKWIAYAYNTALFFQGH